MYLGLQAKYSLFLLDVKENWILLTGFRKVLKYQILSKSLQ